MKIVGITGKAGAGKDTIADFLVHHFGYRKHSMAGPLKEMLKVAGFLEPIRRADKELPLPGFAFSYRQAAQRLGTEWGRALDPDIWIKCIEQRLRRATDLAVVSDVRFENEAAMIRRMGGMVLHVTGRQASLGAAGAHVSEVPIAFGDGDARVDNGGDFDVTRVEVIKALGLVRK